MIIIVRKVAHDSCIESKHSNLSCELGHAHGVILKCRQAIEQAAVI